jgi:hypothetical protein
MGKVQKPQKVHGGRVAAPPPLVAPRLTFSFRYFHQRDPFLFTNGPDGYFDVLVERLKSICMMDMSVFRTSDSKTLRSHSIDWEDTTEPGGFDHLNAQLREQVTGWQFSVTQNEHGRVHGFIVAEVFYVVWLDPLHRLYGKK